MKRMFFTVFFCFIAFVQSYAQFRVCAYYDGYWGQWSDVYWMDGTGSYSGFAIHAKGDHPSNFVFRFQIDSYQEPSKEVLKAHRKSKEWFTYTGTVEYYVIESEPTIKDVLKSSGFPYWNPTKTKGPCPKRVAKATIKIAPYSSHPKVYNFWFDGVGFGLDLNY